MGKTLGWLVMAYLSLVTAVFSSQYVLGRHFDPVFHDKYMAMLPVVLTHGLCSAASLALGPTQFWPWLRRQYPHVHRGCGRIYLGAVFLGAPSGFYMSIISNGGTISHVGFCAMAALWFYSGVQALSAARGKRFPEHRAWMVRNYALTFGAVLIRIYLYQLQEWGWDFQAVYPYTSWLAWVPSLLVAEWLVGQSAGKKVNFPATHAPALTPRMGPQ